MNHLTMGLAPTFFAGLALSLSLIAAIGPQNAHLLRLGLNRQYLWTTVTTSFLADTVLIALGVFGLGKLGGLSLHVQQFMLLGGAIFLMYYGTRAGLRCLSYSTPSDQPAQPKPALIKSTRQAVAMALVFSWLNPHAWVDTAILIGAASLAYGTPGNAVFGAGAIVGSMVWFILFGAVLCWLGARLNQLNPWRAIDGLVTVMMLGTAIYLLHSFWLLMA
jgi:L-lysine exporter family protein LysE/ArgO